MDQINLKIKNENTINIKLVNFNRWESLNKNGNRIS